MLCPCANNIWEWKTKPEYVVGNLYCELYNLLHAQAVYNVLQLREEESTLVWENAFGRRDVVTPKL